MIHHKKLGGFTLVEMMLAMAFVGALLLAIAVTSMHIMRIYTKGITIREVNQAGRTITEDVQRAISSSMPFSVAKKTGASSDPIDSRYVDKIKQGGRLCTGTYTYAWNYGETKELSGVEEERGGPPRPRQSVYNKYADGKAGDIRFVKVRDIGGMLCADINKQIKRDQAKELLAAGDRNLAIQSLAVSSVLEGRDDATGQALYSISMVIGTNDQAQLNSAHTTCLPPSEGQGGEDFCAINKFNIIARAGNRSGSL